jgi:hypothetical protein
LARVLPTSFAEKWSERPGDLAERVPALAPLIISEILSGGGEGYVPFAGQSVGLIHDIRPARDIVSETVKQAEQIVLSLMAAPVSSAG